MRVSREDGILRLIFSKILSLLVFLKKGSFVPDINVPYRLMHRKVLLKCVKSIPQVSILKNAHLSYLISIKTKIYYIPIKFLKDRMAIQNTIYLQCFFKY